MATAAVSVPRNEHPPAPAAERTGDANAAMRRINRPDTSWPRRIIARKAGTRRGSCNEGEALIKAFQTKSGLLYSVVVYKAEAEIQGGSPTLVKRPVRK